MLMKTLQTFVSDLPKLDMGDLATRANRLLLWKSAVELALAPAGPTLKAWWKWVSVEAETTYQLFLQSSIHEREALVPTIAMPGAWDQLDSWMRPKLIDAAPKEVKDWVSMRSRLGQVDASHVVL